MPDEDETQEAINLDEYNIRTNKLYWPDGKVFGDIFVLGRDQHPSSEKLEQFLKKKLINKDMIIILENPEQYNTIVNKLMKSEASLAEAQRIAHLGNWEWRIKENEFSCSDEIYRILDLEKQEVGISYEQFLNTVHPDDKELVENATAKAFNEEEYSIDHRIILPDGSERIVHEQAEVYLDDKGKPVRMIGTVQDITERKTLEEKLVHSEMLSAIGQLVGGIAHDFNNQLNVTYGFAQLIERSLIDQSLIDQSLIDWNNPYEYVRDCVNEILEACRNSIAIIRQLLNLAGKGKIESIPIDVNDLVDELCGFLGQYLDVDIKIRKDLTDDICVIYGDPRQLKNALLNLSINARDAMLDGGTLTFKTRKVSLDEQFCEDRELTPGDYVRVTVADTGTGIEEKILSKIFEPFFTTKERGTGLGLTSVYGIVNGHRGFIEVESKTVLPGRGTKFMLYLPYFDVEVPLRVDDDVLIEGEGNILIVDDIEQIRKFTVESLELLKYTAHSFSGGFKAVEYFKDNKDSIDLVILDMNMEDIDGNQTARLLKRIKSDVNILLSTGYMSKKPDRGLFNDVLQKPFKIEELSRKLHEILKEK